MTDFELSLGAQFPTWVLLLAGLVLLGTAVVFYLRVRRLLTLRSFVFLISLRLLAVLLLLLLFFEPVLSYRQASIDRAEIAVLIDTSKSMKVHDFPSQPNRLELVKREMAAPRGLVNRLRRQFEVALYRFDSAAEPIENAAALEKIEPTGEATNIAKAVYL